MSILMMSRMNVVSNAFPTDKSLPNLQATSYGLKVRSYSSIVGPVIVTYEN